MTETILPLCHRAHPHEDDGCPLNHPQHVEVLRDRAMLVGEVERLKAEEGKPVQSCADCRDYLANIKGWIKDLGGDPEKPHASCELEDCITHAKQEIGTLKAEVERLTTERDDFKRGAITEAADRDAMMRRATAAEAKLDDIRAIRRVNRMEPNLPSTRLIDRVLDRS